jgi:hypothetical protein
VLELQRAEQELGLGVAMLLKVEEESELVLKVEVLKPGPPLQKWEPLFE